MNYGNQAQGAYQGSKQWGCGGGHDGHGGHHRGGFWRKMAEMQGGQFGHGGSPVPVNIQETAAGYELHIFAPGRDKAHFSLTVKDRLLTVGYKNPEADTNPQWSKQEYHAADFERPFQLNKKFDETGITARYTEGVLVVSLPKTFEAQQPPKSIELI